MEVVGWLSFWTIDRKKIWFEFQISEGKQMWCIGDFGTFRQEAIRKTTKLVKLKFPDLVVPEIPVEFSPPKSGSFR